MYKLDRKPKILNFFFLRDSLKLKSIMGILKFFEF